MKKYNIACMVCGKKDTFEDTHDLSQHKWQIIAWNVKTAEPKCVCDECEYFVVEKKDK